MKKKLNTAFFSMCFLAALMAEAYCFIVLEGDLFSVVGIGIVVLITGYLLMDSLKSKLEQTTESIKFYVDSMYREEAEKWSERYTELLNIQKATYSATKKNTSLIAEQLDELTVRLETLENNNIGALQKITELQKKSLEGQKNALNLEINYNRQNTMQIINTLREEAENADSSEHLIKILSALEKNNKLMKGYINGLKSLEGGKATQDEDGESDFTEENEAIQEQEFTQNTYVEQDFSDTAEQEDYIENASETSWSADEEQESEAVNIDMNQYLDEASETVKPTVIPLYDDPNKSLTSDEIAALFASFGQ